MSLTEKIKDTARGIWHRGVKRVLPIGLASLMALQAQAYALGPSNQVYGSFRDNYESYFVPVKKRNKREFEEYIRNEHERIEKSNLSRSQQEILKNVNSEEKKEDKESKFHKFMKKLEIGASYGLQFNAKSPEEGYLSEVNNDFKRGMYTSRTPIPQWRNIGISNPSETPLEFSLTYNVGNFKKLKNIKLGLVGGFSKAKAESNYKEGYEVYDKTLDSTIPSNFSRKETIETNTNSIGIKAKADLLKRLSLTLIGKLDNYSVSGDINYTLHRTDLNLKQFRNTSYSGKASGTSLESGLEFNPIRYFSIGLFYGVRTGKVSANGKEIITLDYVPNFNLTRDFSPEFNFNSTYSKIKAEIKF